MVNALGTITDRSGRMVSCHRDPGWGDMTQTADLLARAATSAGPVPTGVTSNTTISLIVTNRKMSPGELQRLAVQVHTSMARGIQPFSTYNDGDTLFAVSTQEVGEDGLRPTLDAIDSIASETMWDAILASVPADDTPAPRAEVNVSLEKLAGLVGRYHVGPNAILETQIKDGALTVRLWRPSFFDLRGEPIRLHAESDTEFRIQSHYATRLTFTPGQGGKATAVTVNPGRWAQRGIELQSSWAPLGCRMHRPESHRWMRGAQLRPIDIDSLGNEEPVARASAPHCRAAILADTARRPGYGSPAFFHSGTNRSR